MKEEPSDMCYEEGYEYRSIQYEIPRRSLEEIRIRTWTADLQILVIGIEKKESIGITIKIH